MLFIAVQSQVYRVVGKHQYKTPILARHWAYTAPQILEARTDDMATRSLCLLCEFANVCLKVCSVEPPHPLNRSYRCYHDRDNSDAQTEYAHGYRYCDTTDPYRTIMSYPCTNDYTVARLNWFSNPNVVLLDKPTGTADNDCARAIEDNMVTINYII